MAAAVAELGDAAVFVTTDNADAGTPARLVAAARESFVLAASTAC